MTQAHFTQSIFSSPGSWICKRLTAAGRVHLQTVERLRQAG